MSICVKDKIKVRVKGKNKIKKRDQNLMHRDGIPCIVSFAMKGLLTDASTGHQRLHPLDPSH